MRTIKFETIVLALALAACSPAASTPAPGAIETAIAQTQAAQPTQTPIPTATSIPTSTPIPLSEIDLEAILLVSGDLPTDFVGGQIKSVPLKIFKEIPAADQVIQQGFRAGALASDGVAILLYQSADDLEVAYSTIIADQADLSFEPLPNVGEKATVSNERNSMIVAQSTRVVFVRCHALVYIDLFSGSAGVDVATAYAQRLDKRLKDLVCQ